MRIGQRLSSLVISDIRAMSRACEAVGGINLGQGVCDLPTPPPVARAANAAIDASVAIYTAPEGILPLRQAIAADLKKRYGREVDPASEVVVTSGATGAFAAACLALLDPGDEVILFEPYYGYHLNTVLALGLQPVLVPTRPPSWEIDREAFARAIGPRTRAVVVCTPSNPSGKVWSEEELDWLADAIASHDLVAITDEIYEHIVFDGQKHVPLATRKNAAARTVSISGFSKTFAVTGWRCGYLTAPPDAARRITVAHDLLYVCAPTPLQHAMVAGLGMPNDYFASIGQSYQKKRDILCSALADAGLTPYVPRGAYYVLADIRRLGAPNAKAAAMLLLEKLRIASVPGTSFYGDPVGETLSRFCFAKEDAVLEEAARRIRSLP
ncbi:pyridoxal phosphate-dependent aminotransferase [Polyangium jinanense]|uniref:Aminotransferase class I/II-fold pyridoxal phosphate-dependent enzyme n=1 Tax=Polyangium jinanense TaxID=2829994 RepID=A0A9X4APG6_9BACT|nr:aminotransferase class I/II-fold pyridoxal phosphate-dependent enzyme [Polyangium jinanense]MDC3952359.1 aminotransferase class I/II-fold pyridoxal phosphate-dependent enzyme [Polyangium jinanense]MDC3979988.1 aminotransferase class I/II-fold pyridoxal phosphate-dependent enzyme [Polyangium jinanense]